MDIFSIITLVGGLAFFLYGMNVMSGGLERMAGGKLENSLKKMSSNPMKGLALGMGITIAIQSSSAMTVMLVGLVNSGIMSLSQTIGVIMGSNIGTTLTPWITSLSGIDSSNPFLRMLNPSSFAPIIALVGVIFIMAAKTNRKKKDIGAILCGFAILMTGMTFMSDAVKPLREMEGIENVLVMFDNPFFGVLIGAVITGIIQSSAASVAMLQSLSSVGKLTYGAAIPIIMGQNIGTCVTALISSIGVNRNAKRVAVVHMSFNLIGTGVCLALFYGLDAIFDFAFTAYSIDGVGIAIVHTIFNIFTTLLLLPFSKMLEKIANFVIKNKPTKEEQETFIDNRLFFTPSLALTECENLTKRMCSISHDTIVLSINNLRHYDEKASQTILENESRVDKYEDSLGTYLVKLSSRTLSIPDSRKVSKLLHTIGDFERLSDHAVNILKVAEEINDKKIEFSDSAKAEIKTITKALCEILDITSQSFIEGDIELAKKVEPLEQVIDVLISEVKTNHVNRLQTGECTIELGFILSDLLNNYERVSDHCSNIAVAMIETSHSSFETHEYLNSVKSDKNEEFINEYNEYSEKYKI